MPYLGWLGKLLEEDLRKTNGLLITLWAAYRLQIVLTPQLIQSGK